MRQTSSLSGCRKSESHANALHNLVLYKQSGVNGSDFPTSDEVDTKQMLIVL
jgi:hypothetical protein